MTKVISFEHVGKMYNLGVVGTGMFTNDVYRWFKTAILRQEDPYLKVGEVNDRSKAGNSKFVWALKDITFDVEEGDVVGIIGKNGAGKSTLLKLLSRVTGPTTGTIKAKGRIASLLEVGTGFHPELTGRENIYMNGAILGMTKAEIKSKLDEIIDFSGCERYIDTPVKRYSSGMMVRLGFAVAAHLEPDILVVDEVLAVGDAEFQKKAIGKMKDVSMGEGRTVLFVSHNMASIRKLCKSGILLKNGLVDFAGTVDETVERYLCAYDTQKVDLAERTDRLGNGKFRFEKIGFYDANGRLVDSILSGAPLKIKMDYSILDKSIDMSSMNIRVHITDMYGTDVITFSSYEHRSSISDENRQCCTVEVPRLLLKGGNYNVLLYASYKDKQDGSVCDLVENTYPFTVISSDVWVKGKLVDAFPQAMVEGFFY